MLGAGGEDAIDTESEEGAQKGSNGGSGQATAAACSSLKDRQVAAQLGKAAGSGWSGRWCGGGQAGGSQAAAVEDGQLEIVFDEQQQEEGGWEVRQQAWEDVGWEDWEDSQLQQQQGGRGGSAFFMAAGHERAAAGLEAGAAEGGRGWREGKGVGSGQQPAAAATLGQSFNLGGSPGAGGLGEEAGAAANDSAAAAATSVYGAADSDSLAEGVQLVYEEVEEEEADGQELGGSELAEQYPQYLLEEGQYQQCELAGQYQQYQEEVPLKGSHCAARLPAELQASEGGRGPQGVAPATAAGVSKWGGELRMVAAEQAVPAEGQAAGVPLAAAPPEGQWCWDGAGCEVVMEEEEEASEGSWGRGDSAPAVRAAPAAHAASLAGMLSGEEPRGGNRQPEGYGGGANMSSAQWGLAAVLELEGCDIVLDEDCGGSPSSGAGSWRQLTAGGTSGAPALQELAAAPEAACRRAAATAQAHHQQQQRVAALPLRQQSQPGDSQDCSLMEGSPSRGGSELHQLTSRPLAVGPAGFSRLLAHDAAAGGFDALVGCDAIIYESDEYAEGEEPSCGLLLAEPSPTEPHSGGSAEVGGTVAEEGCGAEAAADGSSSDMQVFYLMFSTSIMVGWKYQ